MYVFSNTNNKTHSEKKISKNNAIQFTSNLNFLSLNQCSPAFAFTKYKAHF